MARVKAKDHEKLDDVTIEKVISMLETENPCTKKAACEVLNISYNTKRLDVLIENHKQRKEATKRKRLEMRTKPVTQEDASYIISEYLSGSPMGEIVDSTYRSAAVIGRVLEKYKVPLRESGNNYVNAVFLPEDGYREEYNPGDLVFSARYNVAARVKYFKQKSSTHGNVYCVFLLGNQQEHAYQPAYELGDLTYLEKELKIKLSEN